ncbi:uncharacterized protein LOC133897361 [Phragmites australis]|uniref:uncharacterized protein LOC133897361 n=1 Tax=Phragmites australis TaxID=29695 RepID=UPI002D799BAA|nr:uncharacterized protein LOC133897361 [Phragmites australis]
MEGAGLKHISTPAAIYIDQTKLLGQTSHSDHPMNHKQTLEQELIYPVKLQDRRLLERSIPDLTLLAEVIEVTPVHCVVQVSKSTGDLRTYREFCRSLSRLLNGEQQPGSSSDLEVSTSE